jgi:hypothetical protein
MAYITLKNNEIAFKPQICIRKKFEKTFEKREINK